MDDTSVRKTAEHFADIEADLDYNPTKTLETGDHAIGTITDITHTNPPNDAELLTFTITIDDTHYTATMPAQHLKDPDNTVLNYPTVTTLDDLAYRRVPVRSLGDDTVTFEPFEPFPSDGLTTDERAWEALQNGNLTRDRQTGEYVAHGALKRERRSHRMVGVLILAIIFLGTVLSLVGKLAGLGPVFATALLSISGLATVGLLFAEEQVIEALTKLQE